LRLQLEKLEDTKGAIRSLTSKLCRQHNREKKKAKRTNNDLQNITYTVKNKDGATRTRLTISRQDMLRVNTDQVD
jgi:hypothetical protein